jgi:endonuclease/exonuclease/phosphatase family metal-dependent hydrolase
MKTPSIKIASLNIERSKHIDRILKFIQKEQPDIFCVQELCKADIPYFESIFGNAYAYVPMAMYYDNDTGTEGCEMGLGIFSRSKILNYRAHLYVDTQQKLPEYRHPNQHTSNRYLLVCDIAKDDVTFCIGTTHFTWTPDGKVDENQRKDISALLEAIEKESELIVVGDFNAPRGGEIFSLLAERYTDNVPPEYTTSIDGTLHRAGELQYMVDGFFSTPGYEVGTVRMECGVSDHCALVGTVAKKE